MNSLQKIIKDMQEEIDILTLAKESMEKVLELKGVQPETTNPIIATLRKEKNTTWGGDRTSPTYKGVSTVLTEFFDENPDRVIPIKELEGVLETAQARGTMTTFAKNVNVSVHGGLKTLLQRDYVEKVGKDYRKKTSINQTT